jgi:hypothetical protein
MKLKTFIVAINTGASFLCLLTSQCVVPSNMAGNGSQTPNSIVIGMLYQPGGKGPARGDSVVMRSYDYLADIKKLSKRSATDTPFIRRTCTDDSGHFQFYSIPRGMYYIEGHDNSNNRVLIEVDSSLFQNGIIELPPDTLKAAASIHGKLLTGYDSSGGYIRVLGLDAVVRINTDSTYALNNLPAGDLRLLISIVMGNTTPYDTIVKVNIKTGVDTLLSLSVVNPKTLGWGNTFQKTLCSDCEGNFVQQTTDGGYIIAGNKNPAFDTGSLFTTYLLKTDAAGEATWMKTLRYGAPKIVQQVSDGGYIILGSMYYSSINKDSLWMIKTDAAGTVAWMKPLEIGSIGAGHSVQQTKDGGFIIVGGTEPNYSLNGDVCLIKIDATGTVVWTKTFGGDSRDVGNSIQPTSDGGYIIVGGTMIKIDAAGTALWIKTVDNGIGNSVQQTSDGGYMIVGKSHGDSYLIKTDGVGTTVWTQLLDGGTVEGNFGQQTNDGGYIVLGAAWRSLYAQWSAVSLIKIDTIGKVAWYKFLGGNDGSYYGQSMQQTKDGGYIITGFTNSGYNISTFLIKTDPNGDVK